MQNSIKLRKKCKFVYIVNSFKYVYNIYRTVNKEAKEKTNETFLDDGHWAISQRIVGKRAIVRIIMQIGLL